MVLKIEWNEKISMQNILLRENKYYNIIYNSNGRVRAL